MTLSHLNDFPDSMSPMLVKELRQGLRAKTFLGLFLFFQLILAVTVLPLALSLTDEWAGTVVSYTIFGFFGLAVLLIQPLRGASALSSEIRNNTLDMMKLSRFSAFKIVWGKWVAITAQTTLLFSSVMPYLILRYFSGGMNLVGELVLMGLLYLASLMLTAVSVALSATSPVIARVVTVIVTLTALAYAGRYVITGLMSGSGLGMDSLSLADEKSVLVVTGLIIYFCYIIHTMLSLGASAIASPTENHAVARRLVAFFGIGIAIGVALGGSVPRETLNSAIFAIATPALIIAFSEPVPLQGVAYKGFQRSGIIGKCAAWFLSPTRASGILFGLAFFVMVAVALDVFSTPPFLGYTPADDMTRLLADLGSLLFPAVWLALFSRKQGSRLGMYLIILCSTWIVDGTIGVVTGFGSSDKSLIYHIMAWHPAAYYYLADFGTLLPRKSYLLVLCGVIFCYSLILFISSVREMRRLSHRNTGAPSLPLAAIPSA